MAIVLPHDAVNRPRPDGKLNAVQRMHAGKALVDAFHLQDELAHARVPSPHGTI